MQMPILCHPHKGWTLLGILHSSSHPICHPQSFSSIYQPWINSNFPILYHSQWMDFILLQTLCRDPLPTHPCLRIRITPKSNDFVLQTLMCNQWNWILILQINQAPICICDLFYCWWWIVRNYPKNNSNNYFSNRLLWKIHGKIFNHFSLVFLF